MFVVRGKRNGWFQEPRNTPFLFIVVLIEKREKVKDLIGLRVALTRTQNISVDF